MREHINVVKIGGAVLESDTDREKFLRRFASLPSPKVLIHGGGRTATKVAESMGIESHFINGRRVTSPDMRDVAVMVYAGLVNKNVVAALNADGCRAIGLTGADAFTVMSVRRSSEPVDYGEVGDVKSVDADGVASLISAGFTPVFCAITASAEGNLLNTNADTVATEIACALASRYDVSLTMAFEKDGVMSDVDNPDSVITEISCESFTRLKDEGIVNGGMIPKIENALMAVGRGVKEVVIQNYSALGDSTGTRICL
ncbi:acetylglutamate kinase [uncultured Duncaniella sp.]|uniref:acetylglutamate kinase n=1 Tax=uncultured Duncaniella sp. TaxID=2768039 RepID=UPI0026EEA812|nr:acetylglutamate kinase [uncultured Duncaniella sp.]